VWQSFFESSTWIFGYGLNYVFNSPLDGAKLERAVKGHDFASAGKRVDALLKTQGLVSALSFGEIKTHTSKLLKPAAAAYRSECWQVSDERAGGIAQVQRSVQSSLGNIRSKTEMKDSTGAPTGESASCLSPSASVSFQNGLGRFPGCATVGRPECDLNPAAAYQAVVPSHRVARRQTHRNALSTLRLSVRSAAVRRRHWLPGVTQTRRCAAV